jgi:hypothetical protein
LMSTKCSQMTVSKRAIMSLKNIGRSQQHSLVIFKAVDQGDKRTRRLRLRVLALRENPRRVRVRVLALLENPRRDRVIEPALRENPRRERVLDRWFEARDSAVDILVLVPWFEYGTRTRMSTDGWLEPQTMDLNGTKKLRNKSRLNLFLIKFHIIFLLFI